MSSIGTSPCGQKYYDQYEANTVEKETFSSALIDYEYRLRWSGYRQCYVIQCVSTRRPEPQIEALPKNWMIVKWESWEPTSS